MSEQDDNKVTIVINDPPLDNFEGNNGTVESPSPVNHSRREQLDPSLAEGRDCNVLADPIPSPMSHRSDMPTPRRSSRKVAATSGKENGTKGYFSQKLSSMKMSQDLVASIGYLKDNSVAAINMVADLAPDTDERNANEGFDKVEEQERPQAPRKSVHLYKENQSESEVDSSDWQFDETCETLTASSYESFEWSTSELAWNHVGTFKARSLHSVILPKSTKERILDDIDRFLDPITKEFYDNHNIHYKRGYLFHGVSGSGKTSLIQALAGYYSRNICFLQPNAGGMTDSMLRTAFLKLPRNSFLIVEDVDVVASSHTISMSGLLCAVDALGISGKSDILIFTTNHKSSLHPDLLRKGRIDVQLEFHHANEEQVSAMFTIFFPQYKELCNEFAAAVMKALGTTRKLSAAHLQHFLIENQLSSKEQLLEYIPQLIAEIIESSTPANDAGKQKQNGRWLDWLHLLHLVHVLHLYTYLSVAGTIR